MLLQPKILESSKASAYSCAWWTLHNSRNWHSHSGVGQWCSLDLCSAQPVWPHEACMKQLVLLIQKHKLETARSRRIDILISISFCGFTAKKRRWNQTKVTLRENLSLWLNFLLLEIHPVYIQLNRMTFDWTDGERKWQDTSGFKLSNLVYCLVQQPRKLNEHI